MENAPHEPPISTATHAQGARAKRPGRTTMRALKITFWSRRLEVNLECPPLPPPPSTRCPLRRTAQTHLATG
eukprot:944916-Pyramimonas_sp.AAC.1